MNKENLSASLRQCVKSRLTLTTNDREFVNAVYDAFRRLLNDRCLQIGSYPRFTSVRPLQDLDILFLLGQWNQAIHNPSVFLQTLFSRIKEEFDNPTRYKVEASLQTHSVSVAFKDGTEEVFSVDVVPAYAYSRNEFDQDAYMIPEIVRQRHGAKRMAFYEALTREHNNMKWIPSDPRGYIEVAKRLNDANSDFRRAVKFVKGWKNACKVRREDFELKSFHIEQLVAIHFQQHPRSDVFDAVFAFFVDLPEKILTPTVRDRADSNKFIDDYLSALTKQQREIITQARDHLLKTLEELSDGESVDVLLNVEFFKRACLSEQYLFDFGIPTLTDNNFSFAIKGEVLERTGGFRRHILDAFGFIAVDREIFFKIRGVVPRADLFKWKVQNDVNSPQPRGEITDHRTLRDPEHSRYIGKHFVECYAILGGVCVAKARQDVRLGG